MEGKIDGRETNRKVIKEMVIKEKGKGWHLCGLTDVTMSQFDCD